MRIDSAFVILLFFFATALASSGTLLEFYIAPAKPWTTRVYGYYSDDPATTQSRCRSKDYDEIWEWETNYSGFGGKFEIPYGSDNSFNCSVVMCKRTYERDDILKPYLDNIGDREPNSNSLLDCRARRDTSPSVCQCNDVYSQVNDINCDPIKTVCWNVDDQKPQTESSRTYCARADQLTKEQCALGDCGWCSQATNGYAINFFGMDPNSGVCMHPIMSNKLVCEYEGFDFELLGNAVLSNVTPCAELSFTKTKNDMTVCEQFPEQCHVGKAAGFSPNWDFCIPGASSEAESSSSAGQSSESTTSGVIVTDSVGTNQIMTSFSPVPLSFNVFLFFVLIAVCAFL